MQEDKTLLDQKGIQPESALVKTPLSSIVNALTLPRKDQGLRDYLWRLGATQDINRALNDSRAMPLTEKRSVVFF